MLEGEPGRIEIAVSVFVGEELGMRVTDLEGWDIGLTMTDVPKKNKKGKRVA